MNHREKEYIEECKRLIEEKFQIEKQKLQQDQSLSEQVAKGNLMGDGIYASKRRESRNYKGGAQISFP